MKNLVRLVSAALAAVFVMFSQDVLTEEVFRELLWMC
jgi:hypothetical protein